MSISMVELLRPLLVATLALSVSACGITAPRNNEGFADLESLGMNDTDQVLRLSIGPTLLRFAANQIDDEPETRELLRSLDGVRIRIYEIDGDPSQVAARMDRMSLNLQESGWEPVMLVRHGQEQAHMLLRIVNGQIRGMTVLVSDGESEAVVVNLMGEIRPDQLSSAMTALDVNAGSAVNVQVASDQES